MVSGTPVQDPVEGIVDEAKLSLGSPSIDDMGNAAGNPPLCDANDGRQSAAALAIRRGTCRLLASLGFAPLAEVPLPNGRRADLAAIGRAGEIWIVEIKSCLADFHADGKWPEYREFADRLWFAVGPEFPRHVLPEGAGLIVADRFGAEILREAPTHKLSPPRAKALHLRLARLAAHRLQSLADPDARFDAGWRGE